MPNIEEIAASIAGATHFGTGDCKHGFWQMELAEEAREKLSIITDRGVWSCRRMPQGFRNASGPFHARMLAALHGLEGKMGG